ncbi:hypothetical protein IIC65_08170, partial [Candidatus Sumerlaeota bacterium]|nr:hypothetical protein [Candidatus Sumerlaeota bacterium]
EYRQALKILESQIDQFQGRRFSDWLIDRAELRFQTGRVDQAIADMEMISRDFRERVFYLRLAIYLHYRGRMTEYEEALSRASRIGAYSTRPDSISENRVATGRILELAGEPPRTILNEIYEPIIEQRPNYAPAHLAAGDLAYRKSDYNLAAQYFTKALAIETEKNMDALAGLAECYWKSNDDRLEQTLEEIFEINSRHMRARAIQVERLLDIGKSEEAMEIINAALDINPVSLRFRALKSGALFLQDELEEMRQLQEEVLRFNPFFSEIFRTTGRIASRHYRFTEGAALQRRALEIDPEDYEARALYAFDLLRLGNEEEGRVELERAWEGNPFSVHVFNMLEVMNTIQDFAVIEQGPFRLQLPKQEVPILAGDALQLLQEAFDKYEKKYEVELSTPVLVQIFDDHDEFMVRSVGLPGTIGYMGICFGQLITMDSPSAREKWAMNWRSVLLHEFVHVITLQKTKNRMPRWLSEGISVYEETQYSPAWGQRLDGQYKRLRDSEPLPGLSDLEKYFTQAKSQTHLMFGYFLSGEFVGFYIDEYGFDALRRGLELIGEGMETEAALAQAAGNSLERIDARFRRFLTVRLAPLDNLPAVRPAEYRPPVLFDDGTTVTLDLQEWGKASSPFTDALAEASKAEEEKRWEDAELALKRAHELFPDYMGADAPLRRLIDLYEELDRVEDLKEVLRQQIEWNQRDFPAVQKLIALLHQEGEWSEVALRAQWGLGIDPFDVALRQTLFEAQEHQDDGPGALETLSQLVHLDQAHATDYRLRRVELLVGLEDWERAEIKFRVMAEQRKN